MTGYTDHDLEQRARQLNPLGYFIKPVNFYELEPVIESVRRLADH